VPADGDAKLVVPRALPAVPAGESVGPAAAPPAPSSLPAVGSAEPAVATSDPFRPSPSRPKIEPTEVPGRQGPINIVVGDVAAGIPVPVAAGGATQNEALTQLGNIIAQMNAGIRQVERTSYVH
jgi:hypothetical protein